jgi:hypothetical protein
VAQGRRQRREMAQPAGPGGRGPGWQRRGRAQGAPRACTGQPGSVPRALTRDVDKQRDVEHAHEQHREQQRVAPEARPAGGRRGALRHGHRYVRGEHALAGLPAARGASGGRGASAGQAGARVQACAQQGAAGGPVRGTGRCAAGLAELHGWPARGGRRGRREPACQLGAQLVGKSTGGGASVARVGGGASPAAPLRCCCCPAGLAPAWALARQLPPSLHATSRRPAADGARASRAAHLSCAAATIGASLSLTGCLYCCPHSSQLKDFFSPARAARMPGGFGVGGRGQRRRRLGPRPCPPACVRACRLKAGTRWTAQPPAGGPARGVPAHSWRHSRCAFRSVPWQAHGCTRSTVGSHSRQILHSIVPSAGTEASLFPVRGGTGAWAAPPYMVEVGMAPGLPEPRMAPGLPQRAGTPACCNMNVASSPIGRTFRPLLQGRPRALRWCRARARPLP